MDITAQERAALLEVLWDHYAQHGRNDLPWRLPSPDGGYDPYAIMVSELMLQQTQVARVIPKYESFLAIFPDPTSLAHAELGDVLRLWQGLGYNRRAKFLWQAAQAVVRQGSFPSTLPELVKLPGVGVNTAGAILAYSYNQPVVFIETNIRTVYIHHFFSSRSDVTDNEIAALVTLTLDHEHPREFYWALMDYGSYLKATVGNVNVASKHYAKQAAFHGSRRQVRGRVLKVLGAGSSSIAELQAAIGDERLNGVLNDLVREGLIRERDGEYSL